MLSRRVRCYLAPHKTMKIPASYEESREDFQALLEPIQRRWPSAALGQETLTGSGLTVDWIQAEAAERPERVFILTTGLHGIEAYAGVYILQLFIEEFLPRLDEKTTGLLLVHAINPWGMQQRRRVNPDNIDLNRSFVDETRRAPNPDYERLAPLINPQRRLGSLPVEQARFLGGLGLKIWQMGTLRIKCGLLGGQYAHPRGLYFGGQSLPQESQLMMRLFREAFGRFGQVLHIDMHTGYGPPGQLTLVNSTREPRSGDVLRAAFGYEHIAAANPQEFYPINGDMVDWLYRLAQEEFPGKRFYSTTFEFGTLGDRLADHIRDMYAMVSENQMFHHGASEAARRVTRWRYEQLYLPDSPAWREAILAASRQALDGILKAEGFLE
jgi:predicted deacylase